MRRACRLWSKPSPKPRRHWSRAFSPAWPKGRMADVVRQRQRLGQLRVQPQCSRPAVRAICVTSSVCVSRLRKWSDGRVGRQAREDLGLAGQAAKGARMQNAGGVAGKRRAVGVRRFGVRAAGQVAIRADGNPRRQRVARSGFQTRHRSSVNREQGSGIRDQKTIDSFQWITASAVSRSRLRVEAPSPAVSLDQSSPWSLVP